MLRSNEFKIRPRRSDMETALRVILAATARTILDEIWNGSRYATWEIRQSGAI